MVCHLFILFECCHKWPRASKVCIIMTTTNSLPPRKAKLAAEKKIVTLTMKRKRRSSSSKKNGPAKVASTLSKVSSSSGTSQKPKRKVARRKKREFTSYHPKGDWYLARKMHFGCYWRCRRFTSDLLASLVDLFAFNEAHGSGLSASLITESKILIWSSLLLPHQCGRGQVDNLYDLNSFSLLKL